MQTLAAFLLLAACGQAPAPPAGAPPVAEARDDPNARFAALNDAMAARQATLDGAGLLVACALPPSVNNALGALAVDAPGDTPVRVPDTYNRGLLFRTDAPQGSATFALQPPDHGRVKATWHTEGDSPPACMVVLGG